MSVPPSSPPVAQAGSLVLDAEALYRELLRGVRALMAPGTRLVGVASGGAWLVERLQRDLGLEGAPSVLSSALHRD
ncbi:MAG: bifunctional pyr operon transcriptional regulator/uracil phosphoribosyltransferase PyrR, partial [Comamonadaceae bacterium]|nr:bifunctional pyr operon transcriptional regulator/uracil phosphoribosyltransferase PyrR [Comamonadaceae bacterium]